jgi:hypothetical protein
MRHSDRPITKCSVANELLHRNMGAGSSNFAGLDDMYNKLST